MRILSTPWRRFGSADDVPSERDDTTAFDLPPARCAGPSSLAPFPVVAPPAPGRIDPHMIRPPGCDDTEAFTPGLFTPGLTDGRPLPKPPPEPGL
ncbi:hypothetical protein [Streptomyces sp. MB09-02B]|uniref:hypothetical protein n=1 Tax=Streptomyces sp. MB09-02B TaxID=3028667 RepID=UPI0029A78071|nr:hypothetical protein [Streptomyces sp. MB09-02B]MDX3638774.1 hypothetical protein [Streptomyces sp. MB09-02B]